jgi:hypothetical protein
LADGKWQTGKFEVGGARNFNNRCVYHAEPTAVRRSWRGKQQLQPLKPAMKPDARSLGGQGSLEHVLDGTTDCRNRTGLPEPRAATLGEERPAGLAPGITREKNDSLAQGRILPRKNVIEGGAIQLRHPQVTQNHVIVLRLELGQGVTAIARRADAVAIAAQESGQGAEHARLIVNH